MKTRLVELPVSTRDGQFVARYSEKGLAELDFPSREALVAPKRSEGGRVPAPIRRWHRATAAALKNVLAGRSPGKFPPLDLSNGTTFQRKVWNTLRKIARGQTKSYGEIARAWQTEGRSCRRWRVRCESGSGFGSVPPRAGREWKDWRLLRRIGLET
jgi:O6-methylguanine-DNA--protein-cysteine methyltransferase